MDNNDNTGANNMTITAEQVHARIHQERAHAIARHELHVLTTSRLRSGRPMFADELTEASTYDDYATVAKIARLLATLSTEEG
jgi:TorA maturation chaperone TorD